MSKGRTMKNDEGSIYPWIQRLSTISTTQWIGQKNQCCSGLCGQSSEALPSRQTLKTKNPEAFRLCQGFFPLRGHKPCSCVRGGFRTFRCNPSKNGQPQNRPLCVLQTSYSPLSFSAFFCISAVSEAFCSSAFQS